MTRRPHLLAATCRVCGSQNVRLIRSDDTGRYWFACGDCDNDTPPRAELAELDDDVAWSVYLPRKDVLA